jgi:D-inositol-3-phosphate glycosyltransferase
MLEAAASELPLVVTPVHGVSEIVGDDEAGLVVGRRPDEFAGAITRLACDRELRAQMGRAGRRRALEFTIERKLGRFLALYRELLPPALADGLEPRSYDQL